MQEKTKSDHFETISNRFLDPKLVYSEKIKSIVSIRVSDSFSSKGTDHQKCWRTLSRIILKPFPIDFSSQNQFIVRKSGQSHRFQFRTFFIKRSQSQRIQENTKSDHFETISNRFLVPRLVFNKKIRSIASISVSDSFSSRGTDYQECRKN